MGNPSGPSNPLVLFPPVSMAGRTMVRPHCRERREDKFDRPSPTYPRIELSTTALRASGRIADRTPRGHPLAQYRRTQALPSRESGLHHLLSPPCVLPGPPPAPDERPANGAGCAGLIAWLDV